ncbi:MAG TPA: archaeosortase/exosortase family protein [Candidatus Nanoarchaeia archaeon]|nr:archaeosortase/exosortase family protein [Candidatus Nanoarchaeia archaeon]
MALEKGFKQLITKTLIFLALFVAFSFIIGQRIVASSLLMDFKIYIYGGMGYILLFSIVGFVIFHRDRLVKSKSYVHEFRDYLLVVASFTLLYLFYILEINIHVISPSLANIISIHIMFLAIFITLLLGIYGLKFSKNFIQSFKKELVYFFIFGAIVYSLMNEVWKLWPFLSLIVMKITYFFLKLISPNVGIIGDRILVMEGFSAKIAEACSGIYSMFIFTCLYLFALFTDWKKLNKPKALSLFIPAIVGAFFVNIFRVTLLFIFGAYVSRDLALGLYHSYVGMIFFLVYFAIFWLLFYNWMKKPEFKSKEDSFLRSKYKKIMSDSLYRNSVYLMVSTLIMSLLGFIFWMIGARLFTTEQVGLATTLISVTGLISSFSLLGLNTGLVRYLPNSKDKDKKINTSFALVAILAIIISSFFLLSTNTLSPKLMFVHDNILLAFAFIFFMIFASFNSLIESIFIAYRSTKFILIKNTIFSSLKILLLFIFAWLGSYGIFTSHMISLIVGFITVFTILIIKFHYKPQFAFYDSIIRKIGKYSFGNYVAGFIGGLPALLLPLLILNKLGAESSAYYFIAMMIATLLFSISSATSNSLFAEGSYNEKQLQSQVKKALKIIASFLIPGIIITILLGKYILLLFGHDYSSEGFVFLKILAISGVFISLNSIFSTLLRVKKKIKTLIMISIFNAILILGFSYLFITKISLGLTGIGHAWLAGQATISIVYMFVWAHMTKGRTRKMILKGLST